jgi:hypothetical protein
MSSRLSVGVFLLLSAAGLGAVQAASVSQQQSAAFTKKMAMVTQRGVTGIQGQARGPQRTPFTEGELNSWFAYEGQEVLPVGVTDPRVTIVGNGKLSAAATVDLEQVAKGRSTGRVLDPWSYLGGRLPVTLSGVLRTQDGVGRFELEEAAVSGIPVPTSVLQDIVGYYSKTSKNPEGVRLDDSFRLPAQIKQIEVGQGQAVVVQ